jgi:hypothetical protein
MLIHDHSDTVIGWAVWFEQPDQKFLYSKTFRTRQEAREYWRWKTCKNPMYKVVKVEEQTRNTVRLIGRD